MKFVSERIDHVKIANGYCVICGNFGKLKKDHVPRNVHLNLHLCYKKRFLSISLILEYHQLKQKAGQLFVPFVTIVTRIF